MDLSEIISVLKERCPVFANRVGGAAEYKVIRENSNLIVPAAYVIPLDDVAEQNDSSVGYIQDVRDVFAVIVALNNKVDKRGQAAAFSVSGIRTILWKALLAWEPANHDILTYDGGHLVGMDAARLFYQFEFGAYTQLDVSDTWQGEMQDNLPALGGVDIKVDPIDPHDKNVPYPTPDKSKLLKLSVNVDQSQEP